LKKLQKTFLFTFYLLFVSLSAGVLTEINGSMFLFIKQVLEETIMLDEKVDTGAIVIITGEYVQVDRSSNKVSSEERFLCNGDSAPDTGNTDKFWQLVQPIDFTS
jgi:hypothetical protein